MSANGRDHVVLIPSYNTGPRLYETIGAARRLQWPVIVVIDGSTDGTAETVVRMAAIDPGLLACVLPGNQGKGSAILHGLRLARSHDFTHALTMDADGQHSAAHIEEMIAVSRANPEAMVLGVPVFDESAPRIRVLGHRIANFWTGIVTPRGRIADSLFGFRVYPIVPLIDVFEHTTRMRRFDFDSEAVIRLFWRGVRPVNVPTPVRYFRRDQGGISHFKYLRDNCLLIAMYVRLLATMLAAVPAGRMAPSRIEAGSLPVRHGPV
jgi:glycosyltransferase involved in cell wall biosynthesis